MQPHEFPALDLAYLNADCGEPNFDTVDISGLETSPLAWLSQVAAVDPRRVAIVSAANHITYGSLLERVQRLSSALASLARHGAIAIYLPNDVWYPAALFACLAAGRTCIVLDRHYPPERNASILTDAIPAGIVGLKVDAETVSSIASGAQFFCVDAFLRSDLPRSERHRGLRPLPPDDPAIVVYTSGSTGTPKGIVLTTRMVLRRARCLIHTLGLTADDKLLSLGSPCTVAGVQQMFEAAMAGATLVKFDLQKEGLGLLLQTLATQKITILFATPALLRNLIRLPDAAKALLSLRCVHPSGDVLLREDLRLIREHLPQSCVVLIVYGATETVAVAQWFVDAEGSGDNTRIAAGYRLPGFEFAVLDEEERGVRSGEAGELWIRSRFISPGEWHGGRIVPRSGIAEDGSGATGPPVQVFRTGDLVRIRDDGLMIVLGRCDRQIKVRGMRVEPYEIESCLRKHPAVLDAAALAVHGESGGGLFAFVKVTNPQASLQPELRDYLSTSLPSFMVPNRLILLTELPMLPGQKVDLEELRVRALQQTYETSSGGQSIGLSRELAMAWTRVLDAKSLSADLSFAEAGGDSLAFLRLIFELEQLLGRSVSTGRLDMNARPSDINAELGQPIGADPLDERTIFFLPGVGGDEPRLMQLRAALSDNPFVVLRYPDWSEAFGPTWGMEGLCGKLADIIQRRRPHGRINLAGYSFGADVAFALALELKSRGHELGRIFVLDHPSPLSASTYEWDPLSYLDRVREFFSPRRSERIAFRVANALLCRRNPKLLRIMRYYLRFVSLGGYGFLVHQALLETERLMVARDWRAAFQALPAKLDADLVLFRAALPPRDSRDLSWASVCTRVSVINVPGDHRTMFESPGVQVLLDYFTHWSSASVEWANTRM